MKVVCVVAGGMTALPIPKEVRAEFSGTIEYPQLSIHKPISIQSLSELKVTSMAAAALICSVNYANAV